MNLQMDTMNCSRVEVSGWDAKEDFFVEKTYFDSEGEGRKEITLQNSLLRSFLEGAPRAPCAFPCPCHPEVHRTHLSAYHAHLDRPHREYRERPEEYSAGFSNTF
jgi:hypothetical protein